MKLSTRGRYGLMAIYHLVLNYGKGPLPISTIAEEEHLSEAYLEQLFSRLKSDNIIKSSRGARGGYELVREPSDISIGEVISSLEGEMAFTCSTAGEDPYCHKHDECSTKYILDQIQFQVDEMLNSISLEDMIKR